MEHLKYHQRRPIRPCQVVLAGWIFFLATVTWAEVAPLVVPRGIVQLFVDDSRIAASHGLQRTLHQPAKEGGGNSPVLTVPPLRGHGTTLQANGTIVRDARLGCWVMYAIAFASGLPASDENGWDRVRLLRFTSFDGLEWKSDFPEGPETVFPRSRADLYDGVSKSHAANVDACTVWYDAEDQEWPYKAWFWFAKVAGNRAGVYYHRSRDGRTFERGPLVLVSRAVTLKHEGRRLLGPSDTTRFVYDAEKRRFLVVFKFFESHVEDRDPVTDNALRSRAFLYVDRIDRPIDLSGLKEVQLVPAMNQERGDFPSDEYYDSNAYRYGSHWLSELKIWHGRGNHPWSPAGSAFLKFMSSVDGLNWRRASYPNEDGIPEVFIANGRPEGGNGGRNDAGYITSFCAPPLRVGDELIYYYGASSYGKNAGDKLRLTGGGIFRARLRLDGFVSVDAGQLSTPLLGFEGDELRVNSVGPVTVEALDEAGAVLGVTQLSGDRVRQDARFDGKTLREIAAGRTAIRLRFTVQAGAALYSFLID